MIRGFAEHRALRARQNILRGVFEQNLKLVGRTRKPRIGDRFRLLRKCAYLIPVAFALVIFHGTLLTTQWFPEKQIRASLLLQKSAVVHDVPLPDAAILGEEYQALLHNHEIPLWRLLGLEVKTIMIDAGHGGRDSGAIGKGGTMEKDLALDIARRLQERLLRHGRYRVLMTRSDDSTLALNKRVELADEKSADIFVSIHLNYLPHKPINMIETFYFGPSADAAAARLAEKENAGSQIGLNNFKAMVKKINDTLKLRESKDLAFAIQKNLYFETSKKDEKVLDYGIKRAPFVVLLKTDIPSVLVEVSCLSNTKEEQELNTESHRENIAHSLETGILDYLAKGEVQYVSER
jgi:N-acetylmuramoyl-L-alanine amidase